MKLLTLCFLLVAMVACDPYGFGFKKNPAFVLRQAFEAALSLDTDGFIKVSGREAMCVYGNADGLAYLREQADLRTEDVALKLNVIDSRYPANPIPVGFWSYYTEKYLVDILEKKSKTKIMGIMVECHYGFDGEKRERYQQLNPKKYKVKECKVIKLMPETFTPLPLPSECELLKIPL
jgi:hypothetical protein